ncbi:MAG TPA: prolyl oligopeptidase family serine peptidase [Gemmatimonadaceae bacterium]|nr:prolyl oligopeptidase family serine peptidase [Gemmatimonadaceae bacterium]
MRTLAILSIVLLAAVGHAQQPTFTLDQVKSYPFPNALTASATGSRIAWALNERGLRNVWVAEGPSFTPRRLTNYSTDDGQEITSLQLSADGKWVVFIRGGDFSSNFDDAQPVNVLNMPTPPRVQILAVPFDGGDPKAIAEGEGPAISPRSDRVVFMRDRAIWVAPLDGSAPARRLVSVKGDNGSAQWSPDGSKLAFVAGRGDHSFIGVYSGDSTAMLWIAPSTNRDATPRWSPDGTRIAFVRRPGGGGAPDSILVQRHSPWEIWTADARTGVASRLWKSPTTLRGSVPSTHGGVNLNWAAGGRITFMSHMDGWPHLYSIPENGGGPLLLTPGRYMAEYVAMSPDRRWLAFAGNAGSDADDIDRRHVVRVPVDRAAPEVLTPGKGLEWTPVFTGDGNTIAYIGATAQRPPVVSVMSTNGSQQRLIAADRIPEDFPTEQLVTPRKVVFNAPDGLTIHSQVFDRGGSGRRPAIIYVHGGPPRQMLLGWNYSDYYSNAYALNQFLASKGYIVMAVNYRLGIGYGRDFHHPKGGGAQGASEYQDIKAAGEWLRRQPNVDPARIGIYGGSYGGYLTALGLARDSDLFAAGVDIHGVHDQTVNRATPRTLRDPYGAAPDAERAMQIAWRSSPIASISTWRSPVLLIHADDDRNVRFSQTVDLVQRLSDAGVPFEEIVIPDDTHHFMLHANQMRVNAATAEFFDRKLARGRPAAAAGGRQ